MSYTTSTDANVQASNTDAEVVVDPGGTNPTIFTGDGIAGTTQNYINLPAAEIALTNQALDDESVRYIYSNVLMFYYLIKYYICGKEKRESESKKVKNKKGGV